jgi:hypothetical protein
VYCIDPPRSGCAASPRGGQREWTGRAGSTAFAWLRSLGLAIVALSLCLLGACSTPRGISAASFRAWDEYKVNMGRRLMAANPNGTFSGAVPEPLLAIPVLEIDLNRDGSVRSIRVQRHPSQAPETVQLAMDAVRRAAPFGDVSHLPQPWRVSEVFLFRDDRKFKPRSLDM